MTESEAKTKWCPMVGENTRYTKSHSRSDPDGRNPPEARCIGSSCMMWKWESYKDKDHGYCGLSENA